MFVDNIEGAGEIRDYPYDLVEDRFRLVSLMALLQFKAEAFCRIMGFLGQHIAYLDNEQLLKEDVTWRLFAVMDEIKREAEKLKLRSVTEQIHRILRIFVTADPLHKINERELLSGLYDRIVDELRGTVFCSVPFELVAYYEQKGSLFGNEVFDKFPSTSFDIVEAGKCLALGRSTACVFHLMRSLEPGLISLSKSVGVDVEKDNWNAILDQIEKKIRERKDGPKDEEWRKNEQFYAEAAVSFRFIKNAWRNYVNHLHEKYTEEEAIEIFNVTRSFMNHLASRLEEPKAS